MDPLILGLPQSDTAPTSLSRGGRDRRVLAASSIPQGVRGLHRGVDVVLTSP
jgi:hypothetical protein